VAKQAEVEYMARRIEHRVGNNKIKQKEKRSGMSGVNSASRQGKRKSLATCASRASEAKSGRSGKPESSEKECEEQNMSEKSERKKSISNRKKLRIAGDAHGRHEITTDIIDMVCERSSETIACRRARGDWTRRKDRGKD